MIKAGIIGATGYAGGELARLLLQREDVEILWYGSRSYVGQKYASVYPNLFQIVEDSCQDDSLKELAERAEINKGTFYLHYRDLYDLYRRLVEEQAQLEQQGEEECCHG